MSDKNTDDRWTIRGVSQGTRTWLTGMASVHGCTIGRFVDALCNKHRCIPVDESKPIREDSNA